MTPLEEQVIWKIFIHICLGLEHLHSLNFIHRDLKSLNIFLQEDYLAKIGDLGCAKELLLEPDLRDTNIERLPNDIEGVDGPENEIRHHFRPRGE